MCTAAAAAAADSATAAELSDRISRELIRELWRKKEKSW